MWFSASTYHAWVDLRYDAKRFTADDVPGLLAAHFPAGFASNRSEFLCLAGEAIPGLFDSGELLLTRKLPDGQLRVSLHNLATAAPHIQACTLSTAAKPFVLCLVDLGELLLTRKLPSGHLRSCCTV
jgi:hypothetical protein